MNRDYLYNDLVNMVHQAMGREVVRVEQVKMLVEEAKYVRKAQGIIRLRSFASEIPYRFFSQAEIEKLQSSPRWYEFANKMVDLLVAEGVLTPFEARMVKHSL
jgi:hypothetical protein